MQRIAKQQHGVPLLLLEHLFRTWSKLVIPQLIQTFIEITSLFVSQGSETALIRQECITRLYYKVHSRILCKNVWNCLQYSIMDKFALKLVQYQIAFSEKDHGVYLAWSEPVKTSICDQMQCIYQIQDLLKVYQTRTLYYVDSKQIILWFLIHS